MATQMEQHPPTGSRLTLVRKNQLLCRQRRFDIYIDEEYFGDISRGKEVSSHWSGKAYRLFKL
ncbi:hypothetical protein [Shouchella miscanthi]|uniref:Uncharacterized protein n=1 Tax=Shouchella miscanthi TaxID=2598861 RepID=A0ABU6NHR4_9BACI|nr:hypothetical protein [Shouchella miscanthi]